MTTGRAAAEPEGWRERAVERSLRGARERAVSRSERFIQVGTEILQETGNLDFTVQELVERSGLSLRSFYQHFATKDDLLLAVLEEAISHYVAVLRQQVAAEPDPIAKLRLYITGFCGAGLGADRRASAALTRYMLLLASHNPAGMAHALEPQVSLLAGIVEAGVASGRLRQDLPAPVLTMLITDTIMSAVEMEVLGAHLTGQPVSADDVWAYCASGVVAASDHDTDAGRPPRRPSAAPTPRS